MNAPTQQQRDAIAARGNVLVAAGAGTGKTSTVAERCRELVLKEKCPLDHILMVTFTEAAAAEMRERIRKALREAAEIAPPRSDDANWHKEQLALLESAPISTLHSFCLKLVRSNFHGLGLDPQFCVLDDSQTQPLIHRTLDELLCRHYAGETDTSKAVRELVRSHGGGRDDSIRQLVVKIHRHAQSLASPQRWLADQGVLFSEENPDTWRRLFVEAVWEWARLWREAIEPYAQGCDKVRQCAVVLDAFMAGPDLPGAAAAVESIHQADKMKWDALKKDFRDPIKSFFTDAEFLRELAADGGAPLAQDWAWSRGPMLTLLALAREFGEAFARAKREMGGIDFADQEQFTLRLLLDEAGKPTAVAQACRERFKFVFVDECQDINAAQDAIIRAVSGEATAANRFLVGDVKQSIYRFRMADPRIFQSYESRWKASGADGKCLPLTENFRSREAVLQFINPVFRQLMRPVIGGLDYDGAAALQFGGAQERAELAHGAGGKSACTELHVITKDGEVGQDGEDSIDGEGMKSDLTDLQATEREARLIAKRLKEMEESGQRVWCRERGGFVPVEFGDMVVLMRGVAGRAEIFAKAFHQAGVPLQAARAGFLDAQEVADVLNLLRLLDNPLQDLPLLGLLRSPFVGLAAEELVELRLVERRGLLWDALMKLENAECNIQSGLVGKARLFLKQFNSWRELIRHSSLTHCIETALVETHYEALLLAGERGAERIANVRQLVSLARRFDPFQREGLVRFLAFIAEQEEAEVRLEPAKLSGANAVRLMTIHASKGLEFPVVVLAGMGARFYLRDLGGDILLDEKLGLCPKVLPPESRAKFPSIAHWLAAQRGRRATLGEELRLLYVAMTRARDALVLVGTAARKDEGERWQEPAPVTDLALVKAVSFLDWLRLWFVNWAKPGEWQGSGAGENSLLRWKFYTSGHAVFAAPEKPSPVMEEVQPPAADELALVRERLGWSYSHAIAVAEPAKTTVTAIRRRAADEEDEEAQQKFRVPSFELRIGSRVVNSSKLSAAERGTAHHTFLQFVDLKQTASALDLRNAADGLERAGVLSPKQAAALDFVALEKFWRSDVGIKIRQTPTSVHRELPFTVRFGVGELQLLAGAAHRSEPAREDDFVVVQGTADLVVLLEKEIWLLDFKTDWVDERNLAAKMAHYTPQLKTYALALERIHQRRVTQCWLHFLALGETKKLEFAF